MSRRYADPREALLACADPQVMGRLREALRRAHPQTMLYLAHTAAQARMMIATLSLGLILADLDLATPSLTEFFAQCRWRNPQARVVALVPHGDDERLLPAVRGGAAGFLIWRDPVDELTARLRKLASGSLPLTTALARQVMHEVDAGGPPLLPEQWQVLALIAGGCTQAQAARQLEVSEEEVQEDINLICQRIAERGAGSAERRTRNGGNAA